MDICIIILENAMAIRMAFQRHPQPAASDKSDLPFDVYLPL